MQDDQPVGPPKEWSTVRTVLAYLLLAALFLFLVISIIAGPPDLGKYSSYFAWLGAIVAPALRLRTLYWLIQDVVQYSKEGWNIDERPPRLRLRVPNKALLAIG